jgi:uncharacterized protein involved in exopolysaccharide biosynthesis
MSNDASSSSFEHPQPRAAAGVTPWSLAAALRRRWLLASALGFVSAAAAVWFLLPPGEYEVARALRVSAVPQDLLFDQQRGSDFNSYKQAQVALLRSRKVFNVALRSPRVAGSDWLKQTGDPLLWLEKNLRVKFPGGGEIMHVSLQGTAEEVPVLTALVDAVADAYLREVVEKDRVTLQKREQQLREVAAIYEKKVKAIRLSMKGLREQAGSGGAENLLLKQKLAMKEYELAVQELARIRSETRSLRTPLDAAGKMKAQNEAEAQRLASLQALEKLLVKDCERLSREAKEIKLAALDLEDFKVELDEADKMRAALLNKAEVLSIESQAPPRISRLDQEAIVVAPDDRPRRLLFSAIAGVGAVGFVLGGIFLLGLRRRQGLTCDAVRTAGS